MGLQNIMRNRPRKWKVPLHACTYVSGCSSWFMKSLTGDVASISVVNRGMHMVCIY